MINGKRCPMARRWLAIIALLVSVAAADPARAGEVSTWLDENVIPWLSEQFTSHPRYKGEPLRVAAFDGQAEAATPDLLSSSLVDRVENRLARVSGVRFAWRPPGPDWTAAEPSVRNYCRPQEEAYVVAIEARLLADDSASVRVRVLDVPDRQWVAGMTREWHGRPDAAERGQLETRTRREDLAGRRDLPFAAGEEDLMAARAAETLACQLLAHPAENLHLWVGSTGETDTDRKVASLVPQYLARVGVVRVAGSQGDANMVLSVESQALDDANRQVWVALKPASRDPELPSVRTSLYATRGTREPGPPAADFPAVEAERSASRLSAARRPGRCTTKSCVDAGPPIVEVTARGHRHLELLAMNQEGALVRLDPDRCGDGLIVKRGDVVSVRPSMTGRQLSVLFAVSARTSEAADVLAAELSAIPGACQSTGLRGAALRGRLVILERRLARFSDAIEWRRVDLRDPVSRLRTAEASDF